MDTPFERADGRVTMSSVCSLQSLVYACFPGINFSSANFHYDNIQFDNQIYGHSS